jgi:capsular exopolysaccharide synthesis family protein
MSPAADFSQLGVANWGWGAEEKYLNTQMEVMRGREVAQAVIDALGLEDTEPFASATDPAGMLGRRVNLEAMTDTYVVELSIVDADPEMARQLANEISRKYVELNLETAAENTSRIVDELLAQIEPLQKKIEQKQLSRIDLAKDNEYYVPDADGDIDNSRLAQLETELAEVQISRGAREATFKAIEEIESRGGSYETLPEVANDPAIQDLRKSAINLQQQIEELSTSYREGHQKLVAVRSALAEVSDKIRTEERRVIAKIKTEYSIDKRREADLQNQLQRLRVEGLGRSETSSKIEILNAEIAQQRRIYDLINYRINEINLNQQTLVNNVRVLEEAMLPQAPIRPRKALNLAAGLMLGLMLGFGTVFLIDYLDNTITSAEDIERYLGVPLLAMVPLLGKSSGIGAKEAYQTLRTSVLFASKARTLKTILITSAGPGEGKSLNAVQLAQALASAGDSVMLIDGDLRRPTVHSRLGLKRTQGLTNCLLEAPGPATWARHAKTAPGNENLQVLTSGPLPPNPAELFSSPRFLDVLKEIRERFTWVVIDSPPLASLADSTVLGSMTDMSILVIKHNHGDREMIRRALNQLRKVDANIIGAVLNQVNLKRAGYLDYYYAGYQYESKQDDEGTPQKKKPRLVGRDRR